MNLYFLGPKGTYTELGAKKAEKFLKKDLNLIPISTIAKVVDLVDKEENSLGILPIENSIEGVVRPTIDSLHSTQCKIQAQLEVEIKHCIAGNGKKEDIKHIISHPQALVQCQQYILDNFDENIDLISSASTALGLDMLKTKDKTYSAIGSLIHAKELNLNIIDENIGDIKDNKTRFILISKNNLKLNIIKTRTSIIFNTINKPGALLAILEIFKKHNSNLIYLESRPSRIVFGEYNFFADIDKGEYDIRQALMEVQEHCKYYKMLGSYFNID